MEKNKQKRNRVRITISVLSILAVVCLGLYLCKDLIYREKAQKDFEELVKDVEEDPPSENSIIPVRDLDWEAIQRVNSDIYAWIYIPDTRIDYPVMQRKNDDEYYLNHNMDQSTGYPGCIYSEDTYNGTDFTDLNTLLYGHNMKNGTMFAGLHQYSDKKYYENHNNIFIYTPDKSYAYEIFCALDVDDRHLLDGWDFSQDGILEFYENEIKKIGSGIFDSDATFSDDDRILTLSTCTTTTEGDRRYIVQGRLTEVK